MMLPNQAHFDPLRPQPHYESWFQRANHPTRPLAFWIRYTVFIPRENAHQDAQAELWAFYFDGERGRCIPLEQRWPLHQARFDTHRSRFCIEMGGARLDERSLTGQATRQPQSESIPINENSQPWMAESRANPEGCEHDASNNTELGKATDPQPHCLRWDLRYTCEEPPLLLLPPWLYRQSWVKAKALVPCPNAIFDGRLWLDDELVEVDGWQGSQNHNWGRAHTDQYAWGQVAGFDEDAGAFLECSTARLRLGPLQTPWLSFAVLRLNGEELRFDSLCSALRADAHIAPFETGSHQAELPPLAWTLHTRNRAARLRLRFTASADLAVSANYRNPPGGTKRCINSKLAACELKLERRGKPLLRLHSQHRAAFELLSDSVG